jgi:hypothetical protein
LWADANVSEEHTSFIFGLEVCRFRNKLRCTGNISGMWVWDRECENKGAKSELRKFLAYFSYSENIKGGL